MMWMKWKKLLKSMRDENANYQMLHMGNISHLLPSFLYVKKLLFSFLDQVLAHNLGLTFRICFN